MDDLDKAFARHSAALCGQCRFNVGIDCDKLKTCLYCGWNPAVAKQRVIRIREELRGRKKKKWMLGNGTF